MQQTIKVQQLPRKITPCELLKLIRPSPTLGSKNFFYKKLIERPVYFITTRRERIISFGQRNAGIIRRVLLDTAETGMTEGIIPLMSVPDADPIVGVSRLSIIRSLAEAQAIKKGIPMSDVDHAMEIAIAIHDAYGRLAVDQGVVDTDIAAKIRDELFAEGLLRVPIEKEAPVVISWADYARGREPRVLNGFQVNGGRDPNKHLRSIT